VCHIFHRFIYMMYWLRPQVVDLPSDGASGRLLPDNFWSVIRNAVTPRYCWWSVIFIFRFSLGKEVCLSDNIIHSRQPPPSSLVSSSWRHVCDNLIRTLFCRLCLGLCWCIVTASPWSCSYRTVVATEEFLMTMTSEKHLPDMVELYSVVELLQS